MRRHIQIKFLSFLFVVLPLILALPHTRPHTIFLIDREYLKLRILDHGIRHSLRAVVVVLGVLQGWRLQSGSLGLLAPLGISCLLELHFKAIIYGLGFAACFVGAGARSFVAGRRALVE